MRDSESEAGVRLVDILPALRDELLGHRHANAGAAPKNLVFPTSSGSRRDEDNARERVIRPVVTHADSCSPGAAAHLPEGVSAHKLRHTFASILFVRGKDPPYVMGQLGHTDPAFTLRVYAHAMRREEGEKERLKALSERRDWAPFGMAAKTPCGLPGKRSAKRKTPRMQGLQTMGAAGFEPATSRV